MDSLDDNEGMNDGEPGSNDDNNDQVLRDPVGGQYGPREARGGHGPKETKEPFGPLAPVFMNLHARCPIFSTKDDEDAKIQHLCSNDWMNSQGTAEGSNYDRFCLILGGNSQL